ncbi:hypothetical protein [Comamonas sp. CAH-2]|nr:hypothetical protein [Comamonas sp. CAH-2]
MRLAARLLRGQHRELAQWLESAVQQHVYQGTDMDHTLGFAGTLGRSPRFDVLRARRNRLLTRALVVLHNDVQALHRELRRYEERVPAALRERAEPDPSWPLARQLIHRAYQQGLGVPGTLFGLRKALRHIR